MFSAWLIPLFQFSTSVLVAAILGYVFATYHYGKWKSLGVPHTKPTPLFGHLADFIRNRRPLNELVQSLYRHFDGQRYFGMYQGRNPVLVVCDPALVHAMLVKDFESFHDRIANKVSFEHDDLFDHLLNLQGHRWKAVRTKLTPTFTSSKLKTMLNDIRECTSRLLDSLDEQIIKNDGTVDISEVTAQYAVDVIGRCVFGLDFNTLSDPNSEFRQIGRGALSPTRKTIVSNFFRLIDFGRILDLFRVRGMPDYVYDYFDTMLKIAMEQHRKGENSRNDFISLMVKIRNEEELKDPKQRLFNDEIISANSFVFFIAGFETTASTISYCLYELARSPEIQNKLREKIIETFDANGEEVTYDLLKDLKYLDMVINETLRLHPPVPTLMRVCTKKYTLPDSGLTLNVGDKVIIPTYSLHGDHKYYPNPEVFDPERFNDDNKSKIPLGAFLAFSEGPRVCIGKRFALMEIKTGLAKILTKYEVFHCKDTKTPIKIKPQSFLLTPVEPICLKLKKIKQS